MFCLFDNAFALYVYCNNYYKNHALIMHQPYMVVYDNIYVMGAQSLITWTNLLLLRMSRHLRHGHELSATGCSIQTILIAVSTWISN